MTNQQNIYILRDPAAWAAHRRAVVYTVRRRVPGIDAEVVASRGLAAVCEQIMEKGAVKRPAEAWCNAALDAAFAMLRTVLLSAVQGVRPAGAVAMPPSFPPRRRTAA